MIGIVVSRADSASEHIGEHVLDLRTWDELTDDTRPAADGGGMVYRSGPFELRTFDELHLHLEDVATAFSDPALVVFASRHSGDTGPLLTGHFTGNFGPAEYGGVDGTLATTAPAALDTVVAAFEEYAPDGYDVGIECTHHGPSAVGAPSLFVELGSDEPQWSDPEAARAVARSILSLDELAEDGQVDPFDTRTVVGFGGGHYAPRFERVLRETDWSIGHVASDWTIDAMGDPAASQDIVRQAFERSATAYALLDGDHPKLASVIDELGNRVVSETWLREVDEIVPAADEYGDRGEWFTMVERLEEALCPVDAGLRFGEAATELDPGSESPFAVIDMPPELVSEAHVADAGRTLDTITGVTVAYETEENGNRVVGRAAVRDVTDYDVLVERLVAILQDAYDAVEWDGDEVMIREQIFAPDMARELGVEEGPKFGMLTSGQAVTVGEQTITPEDVFERRIRRIQTR